MYCDTGNSVFIWLVRVRVFTLSFKNKLERKVAQTSDKQEMLGVSCDLIITGSILFCKYLEDYVTSSYN